jgi:hypothetical protein
VPLDQRRERIFPVGPDPAEEPLDQLRIGQPPDRARRKEGPDLPEGLIR